MNKKTKINIKKALLVIVGLLTLGAIASFVTNLTTREENKIQPKFIYGGLDENGNYVDTKASLVMEDTIEFDELIIKLDIKSDFTYQLYYYDEDNNFIYKREMMNSYHKFGVDIPSYGRIVIYPKWDEDVAEEDRKISLLEKNKIENQITIERTIFDLYEFEVNYMGEDHIYQCERGMTWAEWINSEYNVDGFFIATDDNSVRIKGYKIYNWNNKQVFDTTEIWHGRSYSNSDSE